MMTKKTPAQAAGVADHQWSFEDVVAMVVDYVLKKEEAAFETAFASQFTPKRRGYVREPISKDQIPVPWYLDRDSGGPNPEVKKPGVKYD